MHMSFISDNVELSTSYHEPVNCEKQDSKRILWGELLR